MMMIMMMITIMISIVIIIKNSNKVVSQAGRR